MEPHGLERAVGLFSWSKEAWRDGGARDEAVPGERRRDRACAARGARMGGADPRADGRPQVLRPARPLAARLATDEGARRGRVRGGPRLRRLLDPRLARDPGVRHAPDPG